MTTPATLTSSLPPPQVYYDHFRKSYWVEDERKEWIQANEDQVKRELRSLGFRKDAGDGTLTELEQALLDILKKQNVGYAGSLAGYSKGVHNILGTRVLVTTSPVFITPKPGTWPTIGKLLENMFADPQHDQRPYVYGWLKTAIAAVQSMSGRVPGQALTMAGKKDSGKSILQNLITVLLGGRSAKPYKFMTDKTQFNSDLFRAEHLMIEDDVASTDIRARKNLGANLKQITANVTHWHHGKNRDAFVLTPCWRLTISVNDEPEHLQVLPPMDDSLADKIIILKACKQSMPMPTATEDERQAFWSTLIGELPAFVDFLMNYQIPPQLVSNRFGVVHYHHPDILEALHELSPEAKLLNLILSELPKDLDHITDRQWIGTSEVLEQVLTHKESPVQRQALQVLSYPSACGTYLARLRDQPEPAVSDKLKHGTRYWIIPLSPP